MSPGQALQEIGYSLLSVLRSAWGPLRNLRDGKRARARPLEEGVLSPIYRGALVFRPERCTACEACKDACPAPGSRTEKTIQMYFHPGPGGERELDEFYIDFASCINCYLCVEACPEDALLPGSGLELGSTDPLAPYDRSRMIFGMDQLAGLPESARPPQDRA